MLLTAGKDKYYSNQLLESNTIYNFSYTSNQDKFHENKNYMIILLFISLEETISYV